jgi:hypothetical protein
MRSRLCILAFTALLLALSPSAFAAHDWTAVASTGTVDPSANGIYIFAGPELTYASTSTSVSPIIARYNVTNTYPLNSNPDMPGWNTLELGYSAAGLPAGAITATLIQVDPCNGNQTTLCTVSSTAGATNVCSDCTFTPAINFAAHLYYVQVVLTRPSSTLFPIAKTLRIF